MVEYIRAGDSIVIHYNDEEGGSLIRAIGEQKVGKTRLYVKAIIGAPYGSVFRVVDRRLEYVGDGSTASFDAFIETMNRDDELSSTTNIESSASSASSSSSSAIACLPGDNRSYVDTNTAQKLGDGDIRKLRQEGLSGVEIIKSLISHSDTFNAKTSFAQEKWIKRKEKKYNRLIRVLKATPATVCDVYHLKSKDKICNLRVDSLAQIISLGSIYSGTKVLVIESCIGMVVGSIAYKMRGQGEILAVYGGQQPHFELVDSLNVTGSDASIIKPVPSAELNSAAEYIRQHGFLRGKLFQVDPSVAKTTASCISAEFNTDIDSATNEATDAEQAGESSGHKAGKKKPTEPTKPQNSSGRQPEALAHNRNSLRQGVQSLIIACKNDPLPILQTAINMLAPSSPFVVYCEFMEPLVECFLWLQRMGMALRLQLSDIWCREFQVLAGRVHPQMFMSTSGGFLLSGIYVGIPPFVCASFTSASLPFSATTESTSLSETLDVTVEELDSPSSKRQRTTQ